MAKEGFDRFVAVLVIRPLTKLGRNEALVVRSQLDLATPEGWECYAYDPADDLAEGATEVDYARLALAMLCDAEIRVDQDDMTLSAGAPFFGYVLDLMDRPTVASSAVGRAAEAMGSRVVKVTELVSTLKGLADE